MNDNNHQKMNSIKDVAQAAGVSITTVSRVMNKSGYVSEASRKRVLQAIEELQYKPSSVARSMVTKKSGLLGIIVPHINSPFLASFVAGVEKEAGKKGYSMMSCYSDEELEKERSYLQLMVERRVDGLIVMPVGADYHHFLQFYKQTPIVFAVRNFSENSEISSVVTDDFQASYRIVTHMIQKGHRRIAIIAGNTGVSTAVNRYNGFLAAMRDADIPVDPNLIAYSDYSVENSRLATLALLETQRPTAIYASNNLMCVGVLAALKEKGLRMPEDMSLASFDGFENSFAAWLTPGITDNIHPSVSMGEKTVSILCEQIDAIRAKGTITPSLTIIPSKFMDRGSVLDISNGNSSEQ